MSITRTVLISLAAAALLFALPNHSGLGPDPAFGKGDGGDGGGGNGGGGNGGGGNGGGGNGGGGHGGAGNGGGAGAGTGGGAAGSGGAGGAAGGAASAGGSGGGNDRGSLAAFVASPVFAHVAATVPTTITATPVVTTRLGVQCQTVTQTIDIGGRNVQAAAVLCRQPDGGWQIVPTLSARAGDTLATRLELSSLASPSTDR